MNLNQLVQGIEDATIVPQELSAYELYALAHDVKFRKIAGEEAHRRLLAKGLKFTNYGWLTPKDIGELGIVFINGAWTQTTKEALKLWGERKRIEREKAIAERTGATQSTMKLGA